MGEDSHWQPTSEAEDEEKLIEDTSSTTANVKTIAFRMFFNIVNYFLFPTSKTIGENRKIGYADTDTDTDGSEETC